MILLERVAPSSGHELDREREQRGYQASAPREWRASVHRGFHAVRLRLARALW